MSGSLPEKRKEGIVTRERNLKEIIYHGEGLPMRVGKWMPAVLFGALLLFSRTAVAAQTAGARQPSDNQSDWSSYGGGPDGNRYSSLTQINRSNVSQLQVAWVNQWIIGTVM